MSNSLVSEKIKTILSDKNVSVQELSLRSGLSESAINIILNSEKIPSLSALIKIARGLGVRPGTFLDDTTQLGPVVTRANESSQPATFSSQLNDTNEHLDFYALAGNKSGRHMEPFIITINPAEVNSTNFSTHEGEEFLFVLNGTVKVVYGKQTYELQKGDSIYYDSIVDHFVCSANASPATMLAVVYTPF